MAGRDTEGPSSFGGVGWGGLRVNKLENDTCVVCLQRKAKNQWLSKAKRHEDISEQEHGNENDSRFRNFVDGLSVAEIEGFWVRGVAAVVVD